jgi:hypothetical protein
VAADRLEGIFFRLFGMTTRTMIVDRCLAGAMAGPVAVRTRWALALHGLVFLDDDSPYHNESAPAMSRDARPLRRA